MVFGTVLELIVFLLTILCIYIVRVNYQLVIPSIIISRTTVLLSAVWVFLFSIKKGLFSLLLTNRLFVYLGNISQYMFLIHCVVTYFTSVMIETLNIHLDGNMQLLLIIGELVMSICFSVFYKKLTICYAYDAID